MTVRFPLKSRFADNLEETREFETLSVRFGDGYEQRGRMGYNYIKVEKDVEFIGTRVEIQAACDFLDERGGTGAFLLDTGEGVERLWTCSKYSRSLIGADVWRLEMKIKICYDRA